MIVKTFELENHNSDNFDKKEKKTEKHSDFSNHFSPNKKIKIKL